MANGIELILGFTGKDWGKIPITLPPHKKSSYANRIAVLYQPKEGESADDLDPDGNDEPGDVCDQFQHCFNVYNLPLENAHRDALKESGFMPLAVPNCVIRATRADTPRGVRDFQTFLLQLFYDPDELGDDADSAVIGVSVSGRYLPTFVDWEDASGGLTPIVFNDDLLLMLHKARRHIGKAVPWLKAAPWIVKEIHY